MTAAIVFGGYGTFGSIVVRELVRAGVEVIVAGRDRARAEAFARATGARAEAADVTDRASCLAVLGAGDIAINCAGPFSSLGSALLEACLERGCHHVDIADDRGHVARVRAEDERLRARGLAAVYGCSSLPGISGALAIEAAKTLGGEVERARVTLFIGNDNPKGEAAVRSLLAQLGRPLAAPQGAVRGFGDREVVRMPPPFGARAVYNFDAPEYDLFPALVNTRSVSVKVGFELRFATFLFAILARTGLAFGERTARVLSALGKLGRWLGCSGGAVVVELFGAGGRVARAAMFTREDGQRMAALPAALVARALFDRAPSPRGALAAYELLGATPLLDALVAAGFTREHL